jgi:glycosyltransferase involved in cell wall biosynthesis
MTGLFIPEFPSLTHIMIWRELTAWRARGEPFAILSTRQPDPSACPHAFAAEGRAMTHYVYPPRWGQVLGTLARHPVRTLAALRYVMGLRESTVRERLRALGFLACAADMYADARRQGIAHIHAHSCADSAHIVALCHELGGPSYSLSLHGDLPVYGKDHVSKMRKARFITADGSHLKRQMVEQVGVPPERVFVTCMGVNTDTFHDAGQRRYDPNRLHLATIARLNFSKGHVHAFEAMRRVLDAHPEIDLRYTVAGDGPYRAEVEAEIARLNLGDRVELVGSLSEEECIALLQRTDVFLLPSIGLGEAWPVVVMDAMACGMPVVCSIIGATPEMIAQGVDGLLVEQKDSAAIAGHLVRLARDPEERRRLGAAARERAVASFDYRYRAGLLLDAIHQGKPPVVGPAGT